MRAYIDSDILIWHLRGKPEAIRFFKNLKTKKQCELWIGAMQRAEIVFFMREKEEQLTEMFLSNFQTASVDKDIIDLAGELYRKWHPSHSIDVNDAILAATATLAKGKIYTLNVKHYPMSNLVVEKAW